MFFAFVAEGKPFNKFSYYWKAVLPCCCWTPGLAKYDRELHSREDAEIPSLFCAQFTALLMQAVATQYMINHETEPDHVPPAWMPGMLGRSAAAWTPNEMMSWINQFPDCAPVGRRMGSRLDLKLGY